MVPMKITLTGFLSYRRAEKFDFSERPLWMLSGDNGAGKSSLFDAITYVLFKKHRCGGQNAADLINRHCDGLKVVFEFQVGPDRYRAERTLERRGGATRRIEKWDGAQWLPIPEAASDRGFEDQITAIVGMDYNAFTSSALLCQGKVDRLLDVGPADRFRLLSQIVDLSRYEALHQRAKARQAQARIKAEGEESLLSQIPTAEAAEIAAAEQAAEEAEREEKRSLDSVTELAGIAPQSAQWEALQAEAGGLEQKVAEAAALVADEKAVRADAERQADLAANLPLLRDLRDACSRRAHAEGKDGQAKSALDAVRDAEECYGAGDAGLAPVERADRLTAAFGADIASLEEAHAAHPYLKVLAQKRVSALNAAEAITAARDAIRRAPLIAATEDEACADQTRGHAAAEKALNAASVSRTRATAAHEAVQGRLDRLEAAAHHADGMTEAVCDYCGQTLTEEARRKHQGDLLAEEAVCQQQVAAALREHEQCQAALRTATEDLQAARRSWLEATRVGQARSQDLVHQEQTLTGLRREVEATAFDLPAGAFRDTAMSLFSGEAEAWPHDLDGFPTTDELSRATAQAGRLATRRKEAEAFRVLWDKVRASTEMLTERHAEADRAAARIPQAWRSWYDAAPASPDPLGVREGELYQLADTPGRLAALIEALRNRQRWQERLGEVRKSVDGLPEQARRPAAVVKAERAQAETELRDAKKALQDARRQAEDLRRYRADREAAQERRDAHRRQEGLFKTLADLLGRENLQRSLLWGAEEAITEYANETLYGFSQGALRLEPRPEGAGRGGKDEALDLLCVNTDTAGDGAPLPLTNLSGSQKFRVAVALALGIGRFASRNDARVESVIIDEGFGSLDRQNQQDMADAIRSLADDERLKRIIVVSHQEAFAEGFPDRIHVALGPNGSHQVALPVLM